MICISLNIWDIPHGWETSTSYLIDIEDDGHSLIAQTKVWRADPSFEDAEDTSSDKADEISFLLVENVNTAVKTNSAF